MEERFDPDATLQGQRVRMESGDLQIGDLILGRYQLIEKLGSGAMGVVFKCQDQVSGEFYALKMVPPALARDSELMEQIKQNYLLVHKLKFPNIASVDFLEQDQYGAYYLIMEYASGSNLAKWLREKSDALSTGKIIEIVTQIAAALDYAHSQRVIHRDIKPANIMVDENNNVKLLDFGLASKVRSSLSNLSADPKNSSGTPNYMAPEQFKAQPPCPASDQYALGVLTFEMLTGFLPFDAENFEVLRSAVINEEPMIPEEIAPHIRQALQKALAKTPKERFESCSAFAAALHPTAIPTVSKVPETVPASPRKRAGKVLLVLVLLLGAFIAYCCLNASRSARNQASAKKSAPAKTTAETRPAPAKTTAAEKPAPAKPARPAQPPRTVAVKKKAAPVYSTEAEKLYREKAEKGDPQAQQSLADCYFLGLKGLSVNYTEAVKWLKKAASQGCLPAITNLGYCYENGKGVKKDVSEAVTLYTVAARKGDANAQSSLGYLYAHGSGVDKNPAEAVKWYKKAAAQGNARAQHNLGIIYMFGTGVEKDEAEAVKWYEKAAAQGYKPSIEMLKVLKAAKQRALAEKKSPVKTNTHNRTATATDHTAVGKGYREKAEKGDAQAQFFMGICCLTGKLGVTKNDAEAFKWFQRSAAQGNMNALCYMGLCYNAGRGVKKDTDLAIKLLMQSAEKGTDIAQLSLGYIYSQGDGTEQDWGEAVKWFRKAAAQKNIKAIYNLGLCYEHGRGVKQNLEKAVELYTRAAAAGNQSAQCALGYCYSHGRGVAVNKAEAVKWFKKSAAQGYARAQNLLGRCYYYGTGIPANAEEAFNWFKKAAAQKHPEALCFLGICYETGKGVAPDMKKAFESYRQAAVLGDSSAQYNLAQCYRLGRGVAKNLTQAIHWYRKAAAQGDSDAAKRLKDLEP